MENEQLFEQMLQLLGQLVTTAGPEWTLQFLQAGLEEVSAGGGDMPPEAAQAGPQAAPAAGQDPMTTALMRSRR